MIVVVASPSAPRFPLLSAFILTDFPMWLTLTVVFLALWFMAVGVFHVAGNAIHLVALLAALSLAQHLNGRRVKAASAR